MGTRLYKFAVLVSIMGLLSIAVVMISKTAYPDLLFQILTPIGLLLIFISLGLYALDWIFSIKKEVKSRNYLSAALFLFIGFIFVVQMAVIQS